MPGGSEASWRLAFLLGLPAAIPVMALAGYALPAVHIEAALPVIALAGVLVGLGTRLGPGCTSGHGVCGIGRGSGRSIAAIGLALKPALVFVAGIVVYRVTLGPGATALPAAPGQERRTHAATRWPSRRRCR